MEQKTIDKCVVLLLAFLVGSMLLIFYFSSTAIPPNSNMPPCSVGGKCNVAISNTTTTTLLYVPDAPVMLVGYEIVDAHNICYKLPPLLIAYCENGTTRLNLERRVGCSYFDDTPLNITPATMKFEYGLDYAKATGPAYIGTENGTRMLQPEVRVLNNITCEETNGS